MIRQARRDPLRLLRGSARRVRHALRLWLAALAAIGGPVAALSQDILSARYVAPTTRYAHGVLGDAVEYGALQITVVGASGAIRFDLPSDHVFEDLAPRLVDLDQDGAFDAVMAVETDMRLGAALALYGAAGKIAETPHIGRRHRWLAPVGAADLDGDGALELAYVDRPHLAKTLRIWRYRDGALAPVAAMQGLTNHRIGEDFITGGIRDCGGGAEMIVVDASWRDIMSATLRDGAIATRAIGPYRGAASVDAALDCRL